MKTNNIEFQRLLLKRAEVNGGNEHGCTPLHYACFNGYDTVAADLIAAGAQVMLCNKRGLTSIDVCQPAIRQAVIGMIDFVICKIISNFVEYAINHNQNLNQKIPYRDQNWMGTKTRAREATLSRYTGVDLQSLQLSKEIAKSHSGALYRGRWQDTEIVARMLNISEVTSRISRDFQTEFPALRIFACANISPVLAAVNHPPRLIVISQFMRLGSLYNVLHEQSVDVIIDHSQSIRFALDIARGMSFLHSMDPMVLRYYLSSKHVVVDDDLSAKISMADTKFSFQEVGRLYSPGWMSPEALQKSPEQSNVRASDMWSFGIVLWELSTREVPFADLSPMEAGMKIALEGLRVQIPPGISRSLFRLINICLNEDPGRRPNFDQVIPILEKMA